MVETKIVLVDFDPSYLATLERVFVREYKFTAEIVLLSKKESVTKFFAEPKTIDILLINENQYDQSFVKHNIEHLFILTEDEVPVGKEPNLIYKYISSKSIIESVVNRTGISHSTNLHSSVARVLMVYSPTGGAGQTTISIGMCALIARNFRRVLYVNIEGLQGFGYILKSGQLLTDGVEKTLQQQSKYAYEKIKPMLAKELFDILPPFPASLASLGINFEHLLFLIDLIKNSGDYDYIVIDGGSDFTEATTQIMAYADQTVLIAKQDKCSAHQLRCLLNNIDCSDRQRFTLVCNNYREDQKDYLNTENGIEFPVNEYIKSDLQITPKDGDYLANIQGIQNLGQVIL